MVLEKHGKIFALIKKCRYAINPSDHNMLWSGTNSVYNIISYNISKLEANFLVVFRSFGTIVLLNSICYIIDHESYMGILHVGVT